MGFHLPHVFAFLTFTLVVSHAALSPQIYWNSVLPNTPMPKALSELLPSDFSEEKSTSVVVGQGGVNINTGKGKGTAVNVGKGGVHVNTGKGKSGGTNVDVGKGGVNVHAPKGKSGGTNVNLGKGGVNVQNGNGKPGGGTNVNVGKGGVGVHTGKPGKRTNVGVGKGGVHVSTSHKGKPIYVGVQPSKNPFNYQYAATETQLHEDPQVTLFFLEKDMHPGTKMTLHFTTSPNTATFLPRTTAESIPFSSNELSKILDQFSVKPDSVEADTIKETIEECEKSGIRGEEKYCATSLESMVDFSTSKLGKNIEAVSTEVEKETTMQKYTILPGVKRMAGDKSIACHKQNYAYAVFYCHATTTTRAYIVPLEGADGVKAKAVAVCHTDTSEWNPKHLAFQVLKVKPGTIPICHFLPSDHIVWVPNQKST